MRGSPPRRLWPLLLAFLAVSFLQGEARAANTPVFEVSKGSATIVPVPITTASGVLQVDVSTRLVKGRFEIEVYNDDADDNLRCGFSVNVSTIQSPVLNPNLGRKIRPNTGVAWKVDDTIKVYCRVEGGADAQATAIISQL